MNDLPEIKFKKKREKRGFLPWLRHKLGLSPASGTPGGAGVASQASNAAKLANIGKAFSAAKIGSSGFAGGILAGKGAMIAVAAIAAGAVGAGLYMSNKTSTTEKAQSAFSSGKTAGTYIPAILRQKKQGSSLEMFVDTNKGKLVGDEAAKAEVKDDSAKSSEAPSGEAPEQPAPEKTDTTNMASDMMAKLMGGGAGDLSSSMGGGSNKFSAMGGFGNKFGAGQTGPKVGFSNNVGASFQELPKFNARKKELAMKSGKRALISKQASGKKEKYGRGAWNQSKGVSKTQKSYSGNMIDGLRSTQDAAWEGTNDGGTISGGGGLSAGEGGGGSGIVTSPSLDNAGGGGGGGSGDIPNDINSDGSSSVPDAATPEDVSPWKDLASQAMTYIMLSAALSAIGGAMVRAGQAMCGSVIGWSVGCALWFAGIFLCVMALLAAIASLVIGIKIMGMGQTMLGMIYVIGAVVAIVAGVLAMMGVTFPKLEYLWAAGAAGIIGMMGSMMNGQ